MPVPIPFEEKRLELLILRLVCGALPFTPTHTFSLIRKIILVLDLVVVQERLTIFVFVRKNNTASKPRSSWVNTPVSHLCTDCTAVLRPVYAGCSKAVSGSLISRAQVLVYW